MINGHPLEDLEDFTDYERAEFRSIIAGALEPEEARPLMLGGMQLARNKFGFKTPAELAAMQNAVVDPPDYKQDEDPDPYNVDEDGL